MGFYIINGKEHAAGKMNRDYVWPVLGGDVFALVPEPEPISELATIDLFGFGLIVFLGFGKKLRQ